MKYKSIILGVLIIFINSLNAQNYRFEHLGLNEGLSQVTVNAIYQDEFGRIWFATRDGLNAYDGRDIRTFRPIPGDSTSLPQSNIRAITGDDKGHLYLQTVNSVVVFDMKSEIFTEILYEGNSAIGKSKNGVWIASAGHLYHHDSQTEQLEHIYDFEDKLLEINAIFETSKNTCLIGTIKGMFSLDENLTLKQYFPNSDIRAIYEDKQQTIWVCSTNKGLIKISPNGDVMYFQHEKGNPNSIGNNFVRAICEDNSGCLWVGSPFGLSRFNPTTGSFRTYISESENPGSLSHTSIMSLYKDKQGTIWVGTYFGGVNYVNPEEQTIRYYYPSQDGLPNGVIGKFTEDKNGIIWICTEGGGLASFNPITEKIESHPIKGTNLKEIYYDPKKHCLWIGTHVFYLIKFDISTKQETVFDGSSADKSTFFGRNIMSIIPFRDELLIGTVQGVLLFNPKTKRVKHLLDKQYRNIVTAMVLDSKNRLWIGSERSGLLCYDFNHKTVSLYQHRNGRAGNLSSDYINSIIEDSQQRIWIGTRGHGLNLYQPKTNDFKVLQKKTLV